jgi:hypothetical protein
MVNGQMRPAGKHLRFAAMLPEQGAGLGDGFGFEVIKVLHDCRTTSRKGAKAQS